MPAGIYVSNDGGFMQIDDTSSVLSYMGMGSTTSPPANPVVGDFPTGILKNYGAVEHPTVAIRSEYRMRSCGYIDTGADSGAWAFNPNYIDVPWEAYFFDTPRNAGTFGIALYNAAGKLIFDGSKPLVVVVDTILLNPGNNYTATKTYTNGRRYAVIAPGVYVRVNGATVTCEGMYTPVAAAGGTINAIVLDVTGYS